MNCIFINELHIYKRETKRVYKNSEKNIFLVNLYILLLI